MPYEGTIIPDSEMISRIDIRKRTAILYLHNDELQRQNLKKVHACETTTKNLRKDTVQGRPCKYLPRRASGGAYSWVCSFTEGPWVPYSCRTVCASMALPKSIRRRCTPGFPSPPPGCRSRFSGFTSLQSQTPNPQAAHHNPLAFSPLPCS